MNSPQNHQPDATTETGATSALAAPPAPTGTSVLGPPPKRGTAALLAMWGILGALASGGGAVVGVIIGAMSASPCTGMLCGLEDVFYGGIIGWLVGILVAIIAAVTGDGSGSDRVVRALFVIVGVVALPMVLALPGML